MYDADMHQFQSLLRSGVWWRTHQTRSDKHHAMELQLLIAAALQIVSESAEPGEIRHVCSGVHTRIMQRQHAARRMQARDQRLPERPPECGNGLVEGTSPPLL